MLYMPNYLNKKVNFVLLHSNEEKDVMGVTISEPMTCKANSIAAISQQNWNAMADDNAVILVKVVCHA